MATATAPLAGLAYYKTQKGFLQDWKTNHRELTDAQRDKVGGYIASIVDKRFVDGKISDDAAGPMAVALWTKFRNDFDALNDYGTKNDPADFRRAMAKI